MLATELLDAVGRYGMPAVSGALVLAMFWRMVRRTEERADRLESKLLGNGDPDKPGKLHEVQGAVEELRAEVAADREQRTERDALVELRLNAGNGQFAEFTEKIEALDLAWQTRCDARHPEAN